ncbi:Phospholipase C [Ascosphaera atra]|nr:Phospholipase C [Ascosphaera atra]
MGAASSHQSTNYSTTSNDSSVGSRATGLMRRFSRGAATKLSRRKQNALLNEGSGPVIIRRRSDSKAPSPSNGPDAIYDSDYEDEEVFDYDGNCFVNGHRTSGGIAPKVDVLLQRGSILTKVSKQRRKQKTFYLDVDSAKVYWDLSNPVKRLYIDNIKEIHTGADARNYREEQQVGAEYEDRWFSIVFACPERSIPVKTIHLIAPSERIFKLWTTTLEDISRYRIGLMAGLAGSGQSEPTLKTYWQREVARQYPRSPSSVTSSSSLPDPDKPLDLPAVETLCRSLHINCSKETLRTQFMRLDKGNQGMIDFTQFQDVLKSLKDRSDLRVVFCELASEPSQGMTLSEFLKFLREVQVEDIEDDTSHWISIFERFVRRSSKPLSPIARALSESGTPNQNDEPRMSFDAFSAFLMSKTNCIYKSMLGSPKFDRPLNEYFISSSHNTYLLGRQVAGSSSTEAYITALQKGCRCLEIDCWDGPDGRPNVCHGRTMTSSVLFSDCITVINRYAFVSSYLPLIISLEVHCNPEQQQAMVDIMKDTFGEKLLLEPLSQTSTKLPTPDELRERILIKVKTSDDDDIQSQPKWPQAGRQRSASEKPWRLRTLWIIQQTRGNEHKLKQLGT